MEISLGEVRHNRAGFEALVDLAAWIEPCKFEPIRIDMRATRWFDADMAAPFGAILYRTQRRLNTVSLQNIPGGVETILSKNGFLSSYGR